MKKILIISVLLAGCAGATDSGTGLTRLFSEPEICEYLYTLNSSATTYKISDAYNYIEESILEHEKNADSYLIVSEQKVENEDAIFGPKHTYKFKVKVYNCKK